MKEFLSKKGLDYEVRDIHTDTTAQQEMIDMGFASIPVTVVGDAAPVLGANFKAIEAALAD